MCGTPPSEAYYLVEALTRCTNVRGDVCEYGVRSRRDIRPNRKRNTSGSKALHLFDSFEGLPKPSEEDRLKDDIFSLGSMEAYTGTMSCPEDMVRARLSAIFISAAEICYSQGFIDHGA